MNGVLTRVVWTGLDDGATPPDSFENMESAFQGKPQRRRSVLVRLCAEHVTMCRNVSMCKQQRTFDSRRSRAPVTLCIASSQRPLLQLSWTSSASLWMMQVQQAQLPQPLLLLLVRVLRQRQVEQGVELEQQLLRRPRWQSRLKTRMNTKL